MKMKFKLLIALALIVALFPATAYAEPVYRFETDITRLGAHRVIFYISGVPKGEQLHFRFLTTTGRRVWDYANGNTLQDPTVNQTTKPANETRIIEVWRREKYKKERINVCAWDEKNTISCEN